MTRRCLPSFSASACALALVVALLAVAPSAAFGHAAFLGSDPAPGQRLDRAPQQIVLRFTETINRQLSTAALYDTRSGKRLSARVSASAGRQLTLVPGGPLGRGAYRVEWHSVAADDGHALEGSFSFGVRAAALGGATSTQAGPLANGGWLRVLVRAGFYPALLLFVGALLLAALLRDRDGGPWVIPQTVSGLRDRDGLVRRSEALVRDAGLLALALASVSAVLDAVDAAQGLSARAVRDYLLAGSAGIGRLALVGLLALALAGMRRMPRAAAVAAGGALLAMAIAGHASSASPRAWAILTDWIHLLAVAVWVGGIALIVLTWTGALRASTPALRLAVMRHVLARFGRIALPAFVLVVVSGGLNALIELGRVSALWQTGYGRVLLVKITLVALIATASAIHALWLRPRLLAANPHPDERLERRHWRLLRGEPLLATGVAVVVALLVAFPVPRQTSAAVALPSAAACSPSCPQRLPAPDELSVAEQGGSNIVAAWIRRRPSGLVGEVRLLDTNSRPSSAPFEIEAARSVAIACGPGCRRFTIPSLPATLRVVVHERGHEYTATLPTVWRPAQSRYARRLLDRAQAVMRQLRGVRELERVSSVPGLTAVTAYQLKAPDRFTYLTGVQHGAGRVRPEGESVVIGKTQWIRDVGRSWQRTAFGGGLAFRTRTWFTWTTYAIRVRLLDIHREHGRRVAQVALMDPGTPAWWRLWIDLGTLRVTRDRLITSGHFMTQRYLDFNAPIDIQPPKGVR